MNSVQIASMEKLNLDDHFKVIDTSSSLEFSEVWLIKVDIEIASSEIAVNSNKFLILWVKQLLCKP